MPAQDLERYDERVRQEVTVHTRVKNLDRAVVRRRRKQRIRRMEVQRSNRTGVIPTGGRARRKHATMSPDVKGRTTTTKTCAWRTEKSYKVYR